MSDPFPSGPLIPIRKLCDVTSFRDNEISSHASAHWEGSCRITATEMAEWSCSCQFKKSVWESILSALLGIKNGDCIRKFPIDMKPISRREWPRISHSILRLGGNYDPSARV